jgi:hypothetical protein
VSVENRLLDDAKSFAEEVADFDDEELFARIMTRLGIDLPPRLATSPEPNARPAVRHGRAARPDPVGEMQMTTLDAKQKGSCETIE